MNVSLALPLIAGRGRSIQIDLSESTKTKISKIRDIILEPTNDPANSIFPVRLTDGTATVIPFSNNLLSDINVYSGYATTPQGGRSIGLDLRQNVKDIINNVSTNSILRISGYGLEIQDSISSVD
jgi:hypothetical protein